MTARERELLDATIAELDASGFDGFTVEAVAARARASKATLYRRWPSKVALVVAAIAARYESAPFAAPPAGLTLREDLLAYVQGLGEEAAAVGGTLSAVLGAAARNPELGSAINEHFVDLRRDAILALFERHELQPADAELAARAPAALIYFRLLVAGEPLEPGYAERIVDGVLLPLLTS